MKKLLVCFALVLFATGYAQNVRFEGIVLDTGKAPLEMANVMAVNQSSKAMDAYAITSDKGKFILNLKANTSYTIKLSYIGMQNKEISVATKAENIIQNIRHLIWSNKLFR